MWGKDPTSLICFVYPVSQNHLFKRLLFSSLNGIKTIVKNLLITDVWVHFWTLNSVKLISTPMSWLLLFYSKFWNQQVWIFILCSSFLEFFRYPISFEIKYKFYNCLVNFYKEIICNSDRNYIQSVYHCLPIHKTGKFYLFKYLIISPMFHIFQHISLLLVLLNLFLRIVLFMMLLWRQVFS